MLTDDSDDYVFINFPEVAKIVSPPSAEEPKVVVPDANKSGLSLLLQAKKEVYYYCLECDKHFSSIEGLVDHSMAVHYNRCPVCPGCNVTCKTRYRLENHLQSSRGCRCLHEKWKPSSTLDMCENCGYLRSARDFVKT